MDLRKKTMGPEFILRDEKKPLPQNEYTVYLELFYQCEDHKRRPFIKPIVIGEVQIEWCSKREYIAKYNEYRNQES